MTRDVAALVARLGLVPHPEGGYYRELFRSPIAVTDRNARSRSALTVIHYLLEGEATSAWHKLGSDETWHFAAGDQLEISLIDEDEKLRVQRLGGDGGAYVAIVPPDRPFAARVAGGSGYALVSCCVAPGFEFDEFELLDIEALVRAYPAHEVAIRSFAR